MAKKHTFDDAQIENEMDIDTPQSKTAVKKAMLELQALGEELLALSPKKLKLLPLSDQLLAAMELAHKIKKGDTRRRQIQLIGKLMRSEDYEGIRRTLQDLALKERSQQLSPASTDTKHPEEGWRDKLLQDDAHLSEFLSAYPDCDRQHLVQLIRLEKGEGKKPKSSDKYKQRLLNTIKTIINNE